MKSKIFTKYQKHGERIPHHVCGGQFNKNYLTCEALITKKINARTFQRVARVKCCSNY